MCFRYIDEFGCTVAKPRFLEQLECYLRRELASLELHSPKLQQLKLQVYILYTESISCHMYQSSVVCLVLNACFMFVYL